MVLGVGLSIIWAFTTEVFASYIRERFKQAEEVEKELGVEGMAIAGTRRFSNLGWKAHFLQVRTYVWLFVILYIVVWFLGLIMKF